MAKRPPEGNELFIPLGYVGDNVRLDERGVRPPADPTAYPAWDMQLAYAMRALAQGKCEPHQQTRIWVWLMRMTRASAGAAPSFVAGPDGQRKTDFAEGIRFVGHVLALLATAQLQSEGREE